MIDNNPPIPPPNLQELVNQYTAEGVAGGMTAFFNANNITSFPPILIAYVLAEYRPDVEIKYPFKKSLQAEIDKVAEEESDNIKRIYQSGNIRDLRGYVHVIMGAATAAFLEEHRIPLFQLIRKLEKKK